MSELDDVWAPTDVGTTRKCHKYGIRVTGCCLHYDCKDCKGPEEEVKDAPKEGKKPRKKRTIHDLSDIPAVKKRGKPSRNGGISGQRGTKKTVKVPKPRVTRNVRRRSNTTHQQRLMGERIE